MKNTNYQSYAPDENGYIKYSTEENETWAILFNRQIEIIKDRACNEYLEGLHKLKIDAFHIPQPVEISKRLMAINGWQIEPVAALIDFNTFFSLLAKRKFPAASFIRRRVDLDYLKEPDIFHEVFGHCPLLTNSSFAGFTEKIGQLGQQLSRKGQVLLARLYWFTVEFGLINTKNGLKIYGAGILSSKTESIYALEDPRPPRKKFNIMDILNTSYHYDELQKVYYIIDSFEELYDMLNSGSMEILKTLEASDTTILTQNLHNTSKEH
jgi:phenylalanine-4-hydroxylase